MAELLKKAKVPITKIFVNQKRSMNILQTVRTHWTCNEHVYPPADALATLSAPHFADSTIGAQLDGRKARTQDNRSESVHIIHSLHCASAQ